MRWPGIILGRSGANNFDTYEIATTDTRLRGHKLQRLSGFISFDGKCDSRRGKTCKAGNNFKYDIFGVIGSVKMGPLEIESKHIQSLDQFQLTRLLKKILHFEADANQIIFLTGLPCFNVKLSL